VDRHLNVIHFNNTLPKVWLAIGINNGRFETIVLSELFSCFRALPVVTFIAVLPFVHKASNVVIRTVEIADKHRYVICRHFVRRKFNYVLFNVVNPAVLCKTVGKPLCTVDTAV